jgi:hypothetical protein
MKIPVQRGLSAHAARASATAASDMRFCTGTVGILCAKCKTSTTRRRARDNAIARPRIYVLRGL